MAVKIRMKRLGRLHRPFYRICAMDARSPRDGRVIEELGVYDPLVPDVDARAILNGERIAYWIGVGAEPTDKVAVLIKKYGPQGTHVAAQTAALEKIKAKRDVRRAAERQAASRTAAPRPARKRRGETQEAAPQQGAPQQAAPPSAENGAEGAAE